MGVEMGTKRGGGSSRIQAWVRDYWGEQNRAAAVGDDDHGLDTGIRGGCWPQQSPCMASNKKGKEIAIESMNEMSAVSTNMTGDLGIQKNQCIEEVDNIGFKAMRENGDFIVNLNLIHTLVHFEVGRISGESPIGQVDQIQRVSRNNMNGKAWVGQNIDLIGSVNDRYQGLMGSHYENHFVFTSKIKGHKGRKNKGGFSGKATEVVKKQKYVFAIEDSTNANDDERSETVATIRNCTRALNNWNYSNRRKLKKDIQDKREDLRFAIGNIKWVSWNHIRKVVDL
ncbi:hypothetical protein QYF36_016833 [Acer negundo]|nr:hypothetical protein QYF36_016833 [Acer negundo]